MLSEADARRLAHKFLTGIYYRGKVTVRKAVLGGEGIFLLEGTIETSPRSPLGRLIERQHPSTFTLRIDAAKGAILDYEVK